MTQDIQNREIIYNIIDLEQRSSEWVQFREGKIGASDVASILGISPWETPLQCWEKMIFNKKKDITLSMQRGIDREQEALDWFNEQKKGIYIPMVLQSKQYPYLIASLDGIDILDGCSPHTLEIKWPSMQSHLSCKEGKIPDYYNAQMQFQFYISGANHGYYLSCWGEDKIYWLVNRDQKYIDWMVPKILDFRNRLIDFFPPEAIDRDTVHINDLSLSVKAERYIELDLLIGELERERDDIRKELIEGCDHPRSVIGPIKIVKVVREGTVNWKDIPALQGVDISQYRRRPIESYRLTWD